MASTIKDIELLAGQRLMVGFEGQELNCELKWLIKDIKVAGIILFSINIVSKEQVKKLCESAQEYAKDCHLSPLIIAVDQEGGDVARLKPPDFTAFLGNPHIKDINDAQNFASITAEELKSVNINMNFAPVVDCVPDSNKMAHGFKSIMVNRAFWGTPQNVATLGSCVIETFQKNGIMAVAKHFPGIGRTTLDSHLELPTLFAKDADKSLMELSDLIPFKAAIKSDVAGIMLSHILYEDLDRDLPASLSYKIAKKLLRDEMGYNGVVMSDDLDMKAIKFNIKDSIRHILNAEVDIALICHKGPAIEEAFNEIKHLISTDEKLHEKAVESANRVESLKRAYL
ncbi:MAG: glycoside hydrolase family 3 protein [Desulfamplus sp.]|nr:glycoside hydrolase family 3 protein [Desulfamplus sp.]